ncbi:lipase secretion chaperone [Pseudomonas sp.]|uniref:lipase secretion chaperone n=1 Tax=Pseudomonas sp. TaxID=306 RepID=UPI003BB6DF9A
MIKTRYLLLLAALCLGSSLAAVLLFLPQPGDPSAAESTPTVAATDAQQAQQTNLRIQQQSIHSLPALPPLPRSLQGSQHGVRLQSDAQGNLLLSSDILHLFDFYLSALSEEPLEVSLNRISRDLAAQLQGPALEQARDLLRRYLEFKIALGDLHKLPAIMDDQGHYALDAVHLRQQQVQALRQQHFSSREYSVFFQEQDHYDAFMQQQLQLAEDQNLDAGQRQAAITQLEQQLPESIRQAREEATRETRLYEQTELLKQQGASAEELFQLRAQVLGNQAATALAQLDERQAQWDKRLASYEQERAAIEQSGLSPQDRHMAVASLIEQRFNPDERPQVEALELYR